MRSQTTRTSTIPIIRKHDKGTMNKRRADDLDDLIIRHGILRSENLARKKRIGELIVCRDHGKNLTNNCYTGGEDDIIF